MVIQDNPVVTKKYFNDEAAKSTRMDNQILVESGCGSTKNNYIYIYIDYQHPLMSYIHRFMELVMDSKPWFKPPGILRWRRDT